MGSWGPVYWSGPLYRAAMALLRGRHRPEMYRLLAREMGELSVLDLCCGDGELRRWLKGNRYVGIDKNPAFVAALRRRGAGIIEGDLLSVAWPKAECVVMVDSLYHFLPDADLVIEKALAAASRKVVIAESIENLAASRRPWVARLAAWAARVDGRDYPARFSAESLRPLLKKRGAARIIETRYNLIGIFEK